jgi:Fe2+ or Zn2+ uptake regulation protein
MNDSDFQLNESGFSALLRRAGCKVTPQRVAVLRALAGGPHLASCQEIWRRARRMCGDLGLVTVYRTLSRLHAAGIVESVEVEGVASFGLTERHHDHMICQTCGALEPMDRCLLRPFDGFRIPGSDFLVTGHRLDLYGICRACQERSRAS